MSNTFEVGDLVMFHPIIGESDCYGPHEIMFISQLSNGTPVAWLRGIPGCVAIEALSRPTGEEGQA